MYSTMDLNQRTRLMQAIARLHPFDNETIWKVTGEVTENQGKLLWALVQKKDIDQLTSVIPDMVRFYHIKESDVS